jgi:hypothetical protein
MSTNRSTGWMVIVGILGLFGLVSGASAQETEIPLDLVPKAVMDSARAKFPEAKIKEAVKETEDGKTVFELEMTHGNRKMDVTFREDGTLILTETQVSENEVPAVVRQAVKDKYPGAKIGVIESVKKGPDAKKEADYDEFHLTTVDKKTAEMEVDRRGKVLKIEEKKDNDKD